MAAGYLVIGELAIGLGYRSAGYLGHLLAPGRTCEDALRESGTLLMTFGPLDAALNPGRSNAGLLIFFALGLIAFVVALKMERSRCRDAA